MSDPTVDAFLERATAWQDEMQRLRAIALDCGLGETLKWGKPCYTAEGGNIAVIQAFKTRCALLFFKGALLKDPEGLLRKPGPNAQVGRRLEFTSVDEVDAAASRLRQFVAEAVAIERAGLRVEVADEAMEIPAELEAAFREVAGLESAFGALTPGRQRAYVFHFAGAKQSRTRTSRIKACVPKILAGKGLRD